MLPSFYHQLLQKYLTPAQLLTLQMLVWLLQSQKEVRIERLAATLQLPILQSSRRRHIQRFLKIKALSILILWFPIVKQVISRQIKAGSQLVIALDRTQWKEHNVLMVSAIAIYSQRYGIEAMFKDCKTGGYNLERCQASPDKLIALIILIALAMTAAWLQGKRTQLQGQEKYVCRLKEPGRNRRRHSKFWIGLYGENWLIALDSCQEWLESMMSLLPNKRAFYQRGLRAIKLMEQPL